MHPVAVHPRVSLPSGPTRRAPDSRYALPIPAFGHRKVVSGSSDSTRPTLLIGYADGTPAIVVSIEVGDGRIQNIWAIANPDKLDGL
jgi:hypothetical protein